MPSEFGIYNGDSLESQINVVQQGNELGHGRTSETPSKLGDGGGFGRIKNKTLYSKRKEHKVCRMEAFWQTRPESRELSTGALRTIQSSWAKGTQDCYGMGFQYYANYCKEHGLDSSTPSQTNLINFLQHELEVKKKAYKTLNCYRSAVSSTLGTCTESGTPVGQAPLVCRFMKGALRLNPPKTKIFPKGLFTYYVIIFSAILDPHPS